MLLFAYHVVTSFLPQNYEMILTSCTNFIFIKTTDLAVIGIIPKSCKTTDATVSADLSDVWFLLMADIGI